MSEMLERAARAAAVACEQVRPSDEHDAEAWAFIARAVLMAVREPDTDTVRAMFDRLDNGVLGEDYDTTDVWQAGLDAILPEGGDQ